MIALTSLSCTPFLANSTKLHNTSMMSKTQTANGRTSTADFATNIAMKRCSSNRFVAACLKKNVMTDHIPYAVKSQLIQAEQYYQFEEALKRIKKTMANKSREDDYVQVLVMIDAIQRFGLEYYFRDDIHAALEKQYVHFSTMADASDNLHDVALGFRLLRQEGFYVSADIFSKFKDKDGKFRLELAQDTKGLLSLFEASHLSIPGDDILDEAGDISMNLLMTTSKTVQSIETTIIRNTLSNPYQKSLPRLTGVTAKNQLQHFETLLKFLHDCFGTQQWIQDVQDIASVDISMSQITLQIELNQLSRWSKEIHMAEVLDLARNQPTAWHKWSLYLIPGPYKAELRTELTKSISFIYIIDDIFDVYGKLEELTLFTEAVNRWEYANINGLPDYMKICLKALYETTNHMSQNIYIKHGWQPKDCLQKAWIELCNAYLVEARWVNSEYLPTTEEYLKNGIVTSGVCVVFATLYCLLGEEFYNHESKNVCNSRPDIVTLAGTLLRLWDDLGCTKDGNQDGYDGSIVACYMNEHQGSSDESARECVFGMISDAWKRLNEECLSQSQFSVDFRTAFLNLARMIPIMCRDDDNHCLPSLERHMNTLCDE